MPTKVRPCETLAPHGAGRNAYATLRTRDGGHDAWQP